MGPQGIKHCGEHVKVYRLEEKSSRPSLFKCGACRVLTEELGAYKNLEKHFARHSVVCHAKGEYVRGPIYTNTIEGYFSILKRGMTGVYQHCGSQHLRRYVGEFDSRCNNRKCDDLERTAVAFHGIEGKLLLYRDSSRPLAGEA